eukprot:TRINITY_DN99334_c0_g1_i1.p1 TRINITY_DN99334_c0_g1~~TRINITY_DN99334_c0_g1_i1.p1  ORF type:complete len:389 (+),score=8.14 TRINITY_DN99334_c0_g1_i1:34-1200(+)
MDLTLASIFESSFAWVIIFIPAALVVLAVLSENKRMAALAQLGGLQTREEARETLHLGSPSTAAPVAPTAGRERAFSNVTQKLQKKLKLQDKMIFTLGVWNIGMTCFIVGGAPLSFYWWHTPKVVILTLLRWWTFYQQKKHYLLYDFCYWANYLCLAYVWFFPHNDRLFRIIFMASNGPLAWSVLAFNHSLIFHSYPHMTSLAIHLSPLLLTYGIRWHESDMFSITAEGQSPTDVTYTQLVGESLLYFYLWWVVLYYIWIFLVLGSYIRKRGFEVLFNRIISGKGGTAKFLQNMRGTCPELVVQLAYMGIHLCFGIFTMTIGVMFWYSKLAHISFIMALSLSAAWNAAGFYFDAFSCKYEGQLAERARALRGKAQQELVKKANAAAQK